jgi:hypothetical protein
MAETVAAQIGLLQKNTTGAQQKIEEEAPIHSAAISIDDTKEIETQIEELSRKNHIILKGDMGKPIKKEMLFPIVVNLLLFSIAAGVLFFFTRYFNRQEQNAGRSSAFSSVEGELINRLKEDSENIISGKDREIATIRSELNALELQRQEALASFDVLLASREAAFREQMREEFGAEESRFAAEGLSQAEIDERMRNFERDRMAQYQQQLADERSAIQQTFDQRERRYHDSIRALNDERRAVQAEIQRQEESLRLVQKQSAASIQELEQARADMQRMSEIQQRSANEEAAIVGMFNKIQSDLQAGQFQAAITDADNLKRILQNMPSTSARRAADIALTDALARMAQLELENRQLQIARSDPTAAALSAERQAALDAANLRVSELQAALNDANRQSADREAALEAAHRRTVTEFEETRTRYAGNLANAVNSIREAKRFADRNDTAAALNAYRQAAGYFELPVGETAVFISGIETLSQNASAASAAADAVTRQSRESDEALARLEAENEQLRQRNRQLTSGAANQSADVSQMQERIARLESENERFRQQTGAASVQLSGLQSRMNQLETENGRLKESEQTLTYNLSAMTNDYNSIKPASDAYMSLVRAYSVYKNTPDRLSNLEHFLNERGVLAAFPGLAEKVRSIADGLTVAARKEALEAVSSILETTLRIQTGSTRNLYLGSMKVRYVNDPAIVDFIDLLIMRL